MQHRRIPMVLLTTFFVIAFLVLGASAIRQDAWTEGYMMGQLAAGGGDGSMLPYAMMAGGRSGSGGFALLLGIGLLFLLFMALGKGFRYKAMKTAGGPDAEKWFKQMHERGWGRPPWCWEAEEKPTVEPESTEPGVPADVEIVSEQ
ncbi:MAG: hypothetical protein U9R25_10500 [Chloroflexota bacterium]|nr:hypothetical protein [Chloroflexota bacterium]